MGPWPQPCRRLARRLPVLLVGLLGLLVAWSAQAAPPRKAPVGPASLAPRLPPGLGGDLSKIPVGAWAEYLVADLKRKTTMQMRVAVVGREKAGTWFEMTLKLPRFERLVLKSLIHGDSRQPSSVKRVIMRAGNLQPVELVGGPVALAAPQWTPPPRGKTVRRGEERVRVPVGVVPAVHYHFVGKGLVADSWTSSKVPLFGLVKFKSRELLMELSGSGLKARSEITGRVGKLDLRRLRSLAPASQPAR